MSFNRKEIIFLSRKKNIKSNFYPKSISKNDSYLKILHSFAMSIAFNVDI